MAVVKCFFHTCDMEAEKSLLSGYKDQNSKSLYQLLEKPTMLVFLRHLGCTFCRQTVQKLSEKKELFQDQKVELAFVSMSPHEKMAPFFKEYGMEHCPRFSDEKQKLYEAFKVKQGSTSQLLNARVLLKGLKAGLFDGLGLGIPQGDVTQLTASFLIDQHQVLQAFYAESAAEQADYENMVCAITVTNL